MVLDSNICITYLNGDDTVIGALPQWKEQNTALLVSSIAITEVLSYPALASDEIADAKSFLSGFISIPFDDALAEVAALVRRMYRVELPDAAIAATALNRNLPLVTRDRQFKKIKELAVIDL